MSDDSQLRLAVSAVFVTDHFRWDEFASHDGADTPIEVKPNLRRLCSTVLEVIRAEFGAPIVIQSGYRSRAWNFKIGGALGSRHMTGEAADIRPVDLGDLPRLRTLVETMIARGKLPGLGGFGRYDNWLHVDCRQRPADGHLARWDGRGVGAEVS